MKLYGYASWPHYYDHIAPIWQELPAEQKGYLLAASQMAKRGMPEAYTKKKSPDKSGWLNTNLPAIVASYTDARQMGDRPVVLVEHGAGQTYVDPNGATHGGYSGGYGRDNVQFFVCPSETVLQRNLSVYPDADGIACGSPRLDDLWELRQKTLQNSVFTVAVSFHWDCRIVPEAGSAFDYFRPTIQKFLRDAPPGTRVIGHGHPKAWFDLSHWWGIQGVETVESWAEVAAVADAYVVDNSSTMYEAAALGIPVVVMESPAWRKRVHHGLRFWEHADVGPTVRPGDGLWDAVEAAQDPKWASRRCETASSVYAVPPTAERQASKTAAQAVSNWLEGLNE